MNKLLLGIILLSLVIVAPVSTIAGINIDIGISLPPPVVFGAPPDVIVLPDTNDVYVVPDINVDMFFWNGWWWRPWEGRWYRSRYYNRGWAYYNRVPSFYFDVDPAWRRYYRDHNWQGHRWNYERIPDRQLQQNWKSWHNSRYWERQGTPAVQGYQSRPQQQRQELRHQRQEQYKQRPEVRKNLQQQQQRHQQPIQPRGGQPQREQRPQVQHSQPQAEQRQRGPQPQKPQGKPEKPQERPERGEAEHR